MRVRRLLFVCMVGLALVAPRPAPSQPVTGVVWTPPEQVERARADLRAMAARGVQAVRTPIVRDERLLRLADSLGLQWYQDLPLAYLDATAAADTLGALRVQLDRLLVTAERHAAVRYIGLAQNVDTSDPAMCAVLRQLAARVAREGPAGMRTYYVTPFAAPNDQCAEAVDLVLLDTRTRPHPAQWLARWQRARPGTPVGIGALGTWVRGDTLGGLAVPHSPEAQARYLERQLGRTVTDTVQTPPAAVFVYRWRDAVEGQSRDGVARPYGLHTSDGRARPAAEVMAGYFTGAQTVFAFRSGTPPAPSAPWLTLLGWALVALLAFAYFREPRLQNMVSRYFGAHNFYQESVREGRDVLVGSTLVVLAGATAGFGALAAVTAQAYQEVPAVHWALRALPDALHASASLFVYYPWRAGSALAAGYVAGVLVWMGGLIGVGRYGRSLTAGQALMLVVWPQWPLWLVLAAALTVPSLTPEGGRAILPWLWGATGGLMLWMAGRITADVSTVARVPGALVAAAALVSPLALAAGTLAVLVGWYDVPVSLVVHLLTRT